MKVCHQVTLRRCRSRRQKWVVKNKVTKCNNLFIPPSLTFLLFIYRKIDHLLTLITMVLIQQS